VNSIFTDIDCRAILNAVSDPLHIIDTEGTLVFANTAWERMIGISLADAQGLHINEAIEKSNSGFYFSFEKDEDTQTTQYTHFDHKNFDSVALTALRKQKPISMFAHLREHQRVLLTSSPLFHDGQIRYALTICQNLTHFSALCDELESAIEKNKLIMDELEFYRSTMVSSQNIIGKSPAIQALLQNVQYVAATDATILITGESGVGKEVMTNEIYRLSKRTGEPFIRVNCASIPESLMESELFGYEKGAFTGAVKTKPGMFELANNGTLLLDEIGELPKPLQPKLLRVLQEREIMRVGGTRTIPVNVRLIAATNQDLSAMVQRGEFRQDLYYRLNLIPLRIPPLRERAEDIPLLAQHFLDEFNTKYGKRKRITEAAVQVLKLYPWPGNIRELENLLERLVIIGDEARITSSQVTKILTVPDQTVPIGPEESGLSLRELMESYERELLQAALSRCGTTYKAAQALRTSQPTVARKAKQYGLEW
jgi:transcriptional regulator with PAS, ATPase and Fis domain